MFKKQVKIAHKITRSKPRSDVQLVGTISDSDDLSANGTSDLG